MVADSTDIGDTSGALRKTPSRELELDFPVEETTREAEGNYQQGDEDEERTPTCGFCLKQGHFSKIDALFLLGGMTMYVADIVTDVLVGVQYFRGGYELWGIMTFVFIILPSIVLQYFSFRWFVSDIDVDVDHQKRGVFGRIWSWCVWMATHLLQLGALKRYWRTLKYGLKSRKDPRYYQLMVYEYRDITMLRLLEAFMESAPQLVLQVYIMVETEDLYWLTACSAVISLGSLSWALESYHKALRDSRADRDNISYLGVILRMVWRLFTITARVIAMALFASIYNWWIFVVAGVHWLGMTMWLVWQDTDFCDTKFEEVLFDAVMAVIHIFCFFNMKEGRTRFRALVFYFVIFIENTIMFALWYRMQESRDQMYGLPALVFVWGGFFLGILTMSLYYLCCHPSGTIPCCVCTLTEEAPPLEEKEVTPYTKEIPAGPQAYAADGKMSLNYAPDASAVTVPSSAVTVPIGLDEVDGMAVQESRISGRCSDRGEYYVNLFSYQSRRQIHPDLLPASCKFSRNRNCVTVKQPYSQHSDLSPVRPEMIDTHAVCRVDGSVSAQAGLDQSTL